MISDAFLYVQKYHKYQSYFPFPMLMSFLPPHPKSQLTIGISNIDKSNTVNSGSTAINCIVIDEESVQSQSTQTSSPIETYYPLNFSQFQKQLELVEKQKSFEMFKIQDQSAYPSLDISYLNLMFNQNSFQQSNGSKYYKVRFRGSIKRKYDLQLEPHIKLTVIKPSSENRTTKSSSDSSYQDSFIITKEGYHNINNLSLVNSSRNTDHDFITIGRQRPTLNFSNHLVVPNDITFHDKEMSKIHCKIDAKQCFTNYFGMKPDFFTFLCMTDRRSKNHLNLPVHILNIILQFTKIAPSLDIIDMGTHKGTYLKIRNDKASEIILDNTYMLGETHLYISAISNNYNQKKRDQDYLFHCLAKEVNKGVEIHGLSQIEWDDFNVFYSMKQQTKRRFTLIHCNRPYLKAEFRDILKSSLHIFIAKYDEQNSTFKIGRAQDCDVIVALNSVSRRQSQIVFDSKIKKWTIIDGEEFKESANGTWESVQGFFQRQLKLKSETEPKTLFNQSQFKVSDSLMQLEFVNFNTNKKRKLNQQFYDKCLQN